MPMPKKDLAPNELGIYFETNDFIGARDVLVFITEVDKLARSTRHFGPDAQIELREIIAGSVWIRLAMGTSALTVAANASTVGAFAIDLIEKMQKSTGKVAEASAGVVFNNSVVNITVVNGDRINYISPQSILALPRAEKRIKSPEVLEKPQRFKAIADPEIAITAERSFALSEQRRRSNLVGRFEENWTNGFRRLDFVSLGNKRYEDVMVADNVPVGPLMFVRTVFGPGAPDQQKLVIREFERVSDD